MRKPEPVTAAEETVTVAVPMFDRVKVCGVLVDPTVTLPKLKLVELAARVPEVLPGGGVLVPPVPAEVKPVQPEIESTARHPRIKEQTPSSGWRLGVAIVRSLGCV